MDGAEGRSPGRWKAVAARLLLAGTAVGLALLAGEALVRATSPQALFPRYVTDAPFGIRVNVPNAVYRHSSPQVNVEFRINSQGIRSDREYSFEKPEGVIRIVGLGDSYTVGYEVDVEETYLHRLEEILRERGHRVEVINLGVSGYGTAEELIKLRELGFRFDPDIVVLGYYANDPADNVRSNLYGLDEEGSLVRTAETYLPAIGLRNRLYAFAPYRWLTERSHLLSLVRERVAVAVQRRMVREHGSEAAAAPGREEGGERAEEYAHRLTAALLDRMKRETEERGADLVILDIVPESLEDAPFPGPHARRITEEDIVPTGPALRQAGPVSELYWETGHGHWTPRTHRIAAGLLADALEERFLASVEAAP